MVTKHIAKSVVAVYPFSSRMCLAAAVASDIKKKKKHILDQIDFSG